MKKRKVIGAFILLIGLVLFSYPLIKQAYSSYRQEELKDAFYEILKENQTTQGIVTTTVSPSITTQPQITVVPLQPVSSGATDYIELEETEVADDTQTANNIKNRLSGQTVIGLIEIKKIDLIYAIVKGTSDRNLGVAIGHMTKTKDIGEEGNCVLAGHRGGTSGPYFKNINQLEPGDEIQVTNLSGNIFVYQVTESFVVNPTETWVTDDVKGQKMLTLITCKDSGTKRLIVRAICE